MTIIISAEYRTIESTVSADTDAYIIHINNTSKSGMNGLRLQ